MATGKTAKGATKTPVKVAPKAQRVVKHKTIAALIASDLPQDVVIAQLSVIRKGTSLRAKPMSS